jgi:hypothetical protein
MRPRLASLLGAGVASLWLAALASGASSTGSIRVTVRPTAGSQKTHFVVRFTAQQTGYVGSSWSGYQVVVSAASSRGCTSSDYATVPPTHQGQHVRVTLTPSGPSHTWCKGSYSGRLEETIRPACGYRVVCPLARDAQPVFIAPKTVGRFSFRVR